MSIEVKYATMIVKDMAESMDFYTRVMGFKVDSQFRPQPETCITLLKGESGAMLELIENTKYEVGLYSVGMNVADLAVTLEELRGKGAKVVMERVPTLVGSMAFVEDPNGVRLALIQHD